MSIKERLEKGEDTVKKDVDETHKTNNEFEIKLLKVGKLEENTSGVFNGSPPVCM